MRSTQRRCVLAVAVAAALGVSGLAGGCGDADGLSSGAALAQTAETVEATLASRYDDVFPDDRVQTVRIVMPQEQWDSLVKNARAEEYYEADLTIDGELVEGVAVRAKGMSSLAQVAATGDDRLSLKVDVNFFNSARTYHGLKKLNFNNGFSDPTLMREFLGYELMAAAGVATPRACFVDLWVNDTHLGVYTMVEQVDTTFLSAHFDDGSGNLFKPELGAGTLAWTKDDVDPAELKELGDAGAEESEVRVGGARLEEILGALDKAGWIPGTLGEDETTSVAVGLGARGRMWGGADVEREAPVAPMPGVDVAPGEPPVAAGARPGIVRPGAPGVGGAGSLLEAVGLKTNENSPDYTSLFALLEVINRDPREVSAADLEAVLDVDQLLRFLAASTALVHLDNYIGMGHNYYLYDNNGIFSIIPWDLNMAFGGFNSGLSRERLIGFYIDEPTAGSMAQYPLVNQVMTEPDYVARYHVYLLRLIEGPFSAQAMKARIDEIAALIRPYVQADDNKFYSTEAFEQGLYNDVTATGGDNPAGFGGGMMRGAQMGLLSFVEQRAASIQAQLAGEAPSKSSDGSGNGGSVGMGGARGGEAPGGRGEMPLPPGGGQQGGGE